jgi:hypothetical protein
MIDPSKIAEMSEEELAALPEDEREKLAETKIGELMIVTLVKTVELGQLPPQLDTTNREHMLTFGAVFGPLVKEIADKLVEAQFEAIMNGFEATFGTSAASPPEGGFSGFSQNRPTSFADGGD